MKIRIGDRVKLYDDTDYVEVIGISISDDVKYYRSSVIVLLGDDETVTFVGFSGIDNAVYIEYCQEEVETFISNFGYEDDYNVNKKYQFEIEEMILHDVLKN